MQVGCAMPLDLARDKFVRVISDTCNESSHEEPGNAGSGQQAEEACPREIPSEALGEGSTSPLNLFYESI